MRAFTGFAAFRRVADRHLAGPHRRTKHSEGCGAWDPALNIDWLDEAKLAAGVIPFPLSHPSPDDDRLFLQPHSRSAIAGIAGVQKDNSGSVKGLLNGV